MRLSGTAAILFIGAVGSAQDLAASAASHRKLNTHVEYPAVRAADDVITADATGRHDDDFREDAPVAGQQCTPSPLWSTDVDPDKYEIGCEEVEVRGSAINMKTHFSMETEQLTLRDHAE